MTAAATGPPDHGQPLAGASDRTNRRDFGGPMVQVCGLGKRYGAFTALDECSLEIQPGEIFGLLGPNGAGKTTLLRCLLGFLRPTSGWAKLAGYDCWSQRTLAHQQLSYMPAQPQLPRLLRARDVLRFFAEIRPSGDSATGSGRRAATLRFERACQLADRLQLDLHRWVALMSTGMRQKLAIAATLCADVPLVFLDEPTANLDPDVRSQLLQELAQLRREGTTVVFSSHVLSEIEQVCDRVAVLAKGRLVGLSNLAQLRQGSVIAGRFSAPFPQPLWDPTLDVSWESGDGHDFRWRTYRRLESILPDLLAAGVQDLNIQTLGLLDVYHQHLAYSPPATAAATTAEDVAANGPSRAAATRVGSSV